MMNKIFYFTGTGNSLQVANDIADILGESEIVRIADFDLSNEILAERVGIVFPIYFWGLPLIVEKFIKNIKLKDNTYVFLIATYGLWPGKALEEAKSILVKRRISSNAGFFIKMPDNYILWYGAKSQAAQQKCFSGESIKIKEIGTIVLQKETVPVEKSKYLIDRLFSYPVNKLSAKRFASTSKKFSVNQNCTGCGLCAKICPVHNICLDTSSPVWGNHCEACLACIQRCPMQAIDYNHKTQARKRYVNPNVKL